VTAAFSTRDEAGTDDAPIEEDAGAAEFAADRLPARTIPHGVGLRIVGDVHGDARAFAAAARTDLFVVQLGDLTDSGPDSAESLRIMFRLIDEGRGLFLLGNHDLKLGRALAGREVRMDAGLAGTLAQLDPDLARRALDEIRRAPAWLVHRLPGGEHAVFVHGGFHTDMLIQSPPPAPSGRVHGVLARALFGEPTGRIQPNGFPERSLRWVDRIPPGLTVYCGHDTRSTDGRPYVRRGMQGGVAVFLDTGAGKGGHLSWLDFRAG
jgi:protein phosphatase